MFRGHVDRAKSIVKKGGKRQPLGQRTSNDTNARSIGGAKDRHEAMRGTHDHYDPAEKLLDGVEAMAKQRLRLGVVRPCGCQCHLLGLRFHGFCALHIEAVVPSPPQFVKFTLLPIELQLKIMRHCLVAPRQITDFNTSHAGLTPAVLRTSRRYCDIGLELLYAENTFFFSSAHELNRHFIGLCFAPAPAEDQTRHFNSSAQNPCAHAQHLRTYARNLHVGIPLAYHDPFGAEGERFDARQVTRGAPITWQTKVPARASHERDGSIRAFHYRVGHSPYRVYGSQGTYIKYPSATYVQDRDWWAQLRKLDFASFRHLQVFRIEFTQVELWEHTMRRCDRLLQDPFFVGFWEDKGLEFEWLRDWVEEVRSGMWLAPGLWTVMTEVLGPLWYTDGKQRGLLKKLQVGGLDDAHWAMWMEAVWRFQKYVGKLFGAVVLASENDGADRGYRSDGKYGAFTFGNSTPERQERLAQRSEAFEKGLQAYETRMERQKEREKAKEEALAGTMERLNTFR